jgi:hypothetical protein
MHAHFVFSSIQFYPPVAIAVLFYLQFTWGSAPFPLSDGACHSSAAVGRLTPLQAHWGMWCHTCLLWPACLFTVHVGGCPSPLRWSFLTTAAVTSSPHSKVSGRGPPFLPSLACLFTVCLREYPSPPLWSSGHPALFAMCLFCFFQLLIYYSVFFLFSLGKGQSVQGAMLICPRKYHVLLICSPGGLPTG